MLMYIRIKKVSIRTEYGSENQYLMNQHIQHILTKKLIVLVAANAIKRKRGKRK